MKGRAAAHLPLGLARVGGIAAVGLLVFQLLRTHVAERYLIESGSMQPALHGDPRTGDIVVVDKSGLLRSHQIEALRRFDVVVVRNPDGGDPLIKRLASLGDESIRIESGDLFVKPLGGAIFSRVQKNPLEHRDLRQTFFAHPADVAMGDAAAFVSPTPQPAGLALAALAPTVLTALQALHAGTPAAPILRTTASINLSAVNGLGMRFGHTECGVDDIGIELDLDLDASCEGLALALDLHGITLALGYARDGSLTFVAPPSPAPSLRGPALGARARLAFGYLDGRLFLTVDEAIALLVPWPLPDTTNLRNAIRVAAAGSGGALVTRLRLFHDIHYRPEVAPFAAVRESLVEPGQVFLLGDNTSASFDSRRRGPFPASDIMGRPIAVIGPLGRLRWLAR